jgi:uncharacterized protein YbbC (DUF1343 family)
LFSPEHGLAGKLDIPKIADGTDTSTGLQVFSLYGETRVPTADSLQNVDTLVFDIQDIGTRFYTYISTMGIAMRAAAEHNVRFVVLDRVNPIGGDKVAGPVLDDGSESFVGFHRIPVRHGMTAGELASMFQRELQLSVDLQVIPVRNWTRECMFDQTALTWVNPSPNMRSLTQALIYPGIGLLETTNISVGRGTDTPFEIIGAPWMNGRELATRLNNSGLPGVRFVPIEFTPQSSKHQGKTCSGVNLIVTNRTLFQPIRTGLQVAVCLRELHTNDWDTASLNRLLSHKATRDAILNQEPVSEMAAAWQEELDDFIRRRREFLLYE